MSLSYSGEWPETQSGVKQNVLQLMGFSNLYNIIPGNKSTALLLITTRKQIGQLALREPIATDKALIFLLEEWK